MLKHREDESVFITSIALRSGYHVETTGSEETNKWSPLVLIDSQTVIFRPKTVRKLSIGSFLIQPELLHGMKRCATLVQGCCSADNVTIILYCKRCLRLFTKKLFPIFCVVFREFENWPLWEVKYVLEYVILDTKRPRLQC